MARRKVIHWEIKCRFLRSCIHDLDVFVDVNCVSIIIFLHLIFMLSRKINKFPYIYRLNTYASQKITKYINTIKIDHMSWIVSWFIIFSLSFQILCSIFLEISIVFVYNIACLEYKFQWYWVKNCNPREGLGNPSIHFLYQYRNQSR